MFWIRGVCGYKPGFDKKYCEKKVPELPDGLFELPADGVCMFRYVAPRYGYVAKEMTVTVVRGKSLVRAVRRLTQAGQRVKTLR